MRHLSTVVLAIQTSSADRTRSAAINQVSAPAFFNQVAVRRAGRLCPVRKHTVRETSSRDDDRRATDWKHCIRGEADAS
jgi:hypothetical protein